MPVADTDIVAYAALNKPIDDTSTNGGGIDIDERVVFTDLAANDDVEVVSSNAGDNMNITVTARNAAGETVQQTVALNGTTAVILSTMGVVERIQRALLASDAAGTVTVRRSVAGATIGTIPPGERGFRRLFTNAVSDSGGAKNYYEKIFLKNTHATLSALNATVTQSADPTGKVTHLLAASKGDSATSTNRLTAPGAADTLDPDTFDDNSKAVPGTNLAAGEAIGVWLKLALNAAEAPIKNTYTVALNFSTA
jgi:hypothetical protein